jgi:cell division protein FtsQ
MKQVWIYIKVLLLLLFVGFLYGFAQLRSSANKISEVVIIFKESQPKFISKNIVKDVLLTQEPDLLKKQIIDLDVSGLENILQKHQMLESAEVFITPKNVLTVELVQRVPIARLTHGNKTYYLDRLGLEMPLSPNYSARVPVVTGVSGAKQEKELFGFLNRINKIDLFRKQIIGIHRKVNGDYLLSTRIGRHKVLLGKMVNVEDKLKRLQVFYKKEWNTENLKQYKLINLKYNHQVVCSK